MGLDNEEIVVVSPDEGSIKRALEARGRSWAASWRSSTSAAASADKTQQANLIGGPIEGKVALIFDDMISTGGSICGAAEMVAEAGAREIYLAATHGIFCGPAIRAAGEGPDPRDRRSPTRSRCRPSGNFPRSRCSQRCPAAGRGDQANPPQRVGQPAVPVRLRKTLGALRRPDWGGFWGRMGLKSGRFPGE